VQDEVLVREHRPFWWLQSFFTGSKSVLVGYTTQKDGGPALDVVVDVEQVDSMIEAKKQKEIIRQLEANLTWLDLSMPRDARVYRLDLSQRRWVTLTSSVETVVSLRMLRELDVDIYGRRKERAVSAERVAERVAPVA
jgi:hypothetical protein